MLASDETGSLIVASETAMYSSDVRPPVVSFATACFPVFIDNAINGSITIDWLARSPESSVFRTHAETDGRRIDGSFACTSARDRFRCPACLVCRAQGRKQHYVAVNLSIGRFSTSTTRMFATRERPAATFLRHELWFMLAAALLFGLSGSPITEGSPYDI